MDPTFLLRLLRRPVTERFVELFTLPEMGTGGGRARAPSCWEGLDMADGKIGRRTGGGGMETRRRRGRKEI